MLRDTVRFRGAANVAAQVLDGEAVMVHLDSGRYYSAEGLAAVLWSLLDAGVPVGEIVARVVERFALSPERASEDIARFVAELVQEELLTEAEEAGVSGPSVPAELPGTPYEAPTLHAYRDMADLLALDPPMPPLKPMG